LAYHSLSHVVFRVFEEAILVVVTQYPPSFPNQFLLEGIIFAVP